CQGPDGRIEYSAKPCAAGQEKPLTLPRSGPAAAAAPAARAAAPQAAASVQGRVDEARLPDYWNRVRCQLASHRVEAIEAALAASAGSDSTPHSRRLNEYLGSERIQVRTFCRPDASGWFVEGTHAGAKDCNAQFAEHRKRVKDWYRGEMRPDPVIVGLESQLMDSTCRAPK
ncbi:MAG TPA: hypothetical protein PLA97_08850, partial [Rubrivivax sp.]|nr:hypothetical protein [Rubrivivax sp.]